MNRKLDIAGTNIPLIFILLPEFNKPLQYIKPKINPKPMHPL